MTYWLNLFTGRTWSEFQQAGANVSGFRSGRTKARAQQIRPGDLFLCYLVGVQRWVGLLEITSDLFEDQTLIFSEELFPIRFRVTPLVTLTPERGVPMEQLRGSLSFFPKDGTSKQWSGYVRGSPTRYKPDDGKIIAAAVREAVARPIDRPVDQRKLGRSANLYKRKTKERGVVVEEVISVPVDEDEGVEETRTVDAPSHTEIQWRLLDLGVQLGLNVWVPRNDRGKSWDGRRVGDIGQMLECLPTQFDEVTNATIENIDVIWFSGQAIVAAFEVEHSTVIYSGLLRLSDLLTMQPNLDIKLYLVGPDDRERKFRREVARATFASRRKPMHTVCRFLPYTSLCQRLEEAKNVIRYLKPEFLDEIAVDYNPAADLVSESRLPFGYWITLTLFLVSAIVIVATWEKFGQAGETRTDERFVRPPGGE